MKYLIFLICLQFGSLNWASYVFSDPARENVEDIRDGVSSLISLEEISHLFEWAKNSKIDLVNGLKRIDQLPYVEQHDELRALIDSVIENSGDSQTELLMRSVLRRARRLDDIIKPEISSNVARTLATSILRDSVIWAIDYYQSDNLFLNFASQRAASGAPVVIDVEFAQLGIRYAKYIRPKLVFSPTHEIRIDLLKEVLGFFFNDLKNDLRASRVPEIANILVQIGEFHEKVKDLAPETVLEKIQLGRNIGGFLQSQVDMASKVEIPPATISNQLSSEGHDFFLDTEFVRIHAGSFFMGSCGSKDGPEKQCFDKEFYGPYERESRHKVTISKDFFMQARETTQGEWVKVMRSNPAPASPELCDDFKTFPVPHCPSLPMSMVSWEDVSVFVSTLNAKVGAPTYRLPTEAEWEYAARAGTNGSFFFGSWSISGAEKFTNFGRGSEGNHVEPVGMRAPNPWGLYDIYGNVREFVQDRFQITYNLSLAEIENGVTDPLVEAGTERLSKGGSYISESIGLRSANRFRNKIGTRYQSLGFRLVRTN